MPFRLATLKLFGQSLSGNKKIAPKHNASKQFWCRWRESNPHGGLAQRILSPPRLPVPTHRHTFMNTLLRTLPKKQEGYAGGMLMKLEPLYQKSNEFATPSPEQTQHILSPLRLPFHHTGRCLYSIVQIQEKCKKKFSSPPGKTCLYVSPGGL